MRPTPKTGGLPDDAGGIVARPDGFYWLVPDRHQEFGPFSSVALARIDRDTAGAEHAPVPGESLQEAESEIGIADWINPDTGEPAEGQSPPRLDEE